MLTFANYASIAEEMDCLAEEIGKGFELARVYDEMMQGLSSAYRSISIVN